MLGALNDVRGYFRLGSENKRLVERVAALEEEVALYRQAAADSVREELLRSPGEKPYRMTVAPGHLEFDQQGS